MANDAADAAEFGLGVALSGETALIGAGHDPERGFNSGAAYVFRGVGGVWQQLAKITPADADIGDEFGKTVGLSGVTAVIGARSDDDAGEDSGSAYVFRDVGGEWQQLAKLTPDDGFAGQWFGASVAISGNTVLVGAVDGGSATAGAVYVFGEAGGIWRQTAKLTPADAAPGDNFGAAISLDGDTAVIGAYLDDDAGPNSGSAYVFRKLSDQWQQIAKVVPGDVNAHDHFGFGVSIEGDQIVVGAARKDDVGGSVGGAAYVFRESGGAWREVAKLTADDAGIGEAFGINVAIEADTAVVGASLGKVGESHTGSAYVFRDVDGTWRQTAKFAAADADSGDYFGVRLSMSGRSVLIGAFRDDERGQDSGAAYVFDVGPPCSADFNGDGSINTLDVVAFLNAWAAGDPSADFNGDGAVNTLDVLAFLNAWAAGC
jgi:hypothetical protein